MTEPTSPRAADPTCTACPKCGGPRARNKGSNGAPRCRRCESEDRKHRRRVEAIVRILEGRTCDLCGGEKVRDRRGRYYCPKCRATHCRAPMVAGKVTADPELPGDKDGWPAENWPPSGLLEARRDAVNGEWSEEERDKRWRQARTLGAALLRGVPGWETPVVKLAEMSPW